MDNRSLLERRPMKRSPQPRRIINLPDSVNRRLNMYALSATAAGVGVLASAHAAEGKIVYTPTHKIIGMGDRYKLDLNHDGITDFILKNDSWCDSGCLYYLGGVGTRSINGIAAGRLYLAL